MTTRYRADIDGLRAVAVMAVVIFHAFPKILPGGFVGVDIFFVISGFLITGIIYREISDSAFSIGRFYARRARRIFPALILVILSTLVVGKFLLLGSEFQPVLDSAIAGALFSANIYFWKTANYFDGDALSKPLLHLWSLGVEEQFYLFWPLLLVFMQAAKVRKFTLLVIVVGLSFAINLYSTQHAPTAAFFLPFGRMWQLAVGGIGAFVANSDRLSARVRHLLSVAGLVAIAYSILFIHEAGFPGWKSLVPTAGALLVLIAGPSAGLNRHLLSRRLPVSFGLISYPLYLWHWPVLSFLSISYGEVSRAEKIYAVVVSIVLAAATYLLFEKPLKRFRPGAPLLPLALTAGLASLAVACLGLRLLPAGADSAQERFSAYYRDYTADHNLFVLDRYECSLFDNVHNTLRTTLDAGCTNTKPGATNLLLWGDSHAQHLRYGLDQLAKKTDLNILQVTTFGCGPSLQVDTGRPACDASNRYALDTVRSRRPQVVVIGQRAEHEKTDWSAVADRLRELGVQRVILMGPVPEWRPFLYRTLALSYPATPAYASKGLDRSIFQTDTIMSRTLAGAKNIDYVSIVDALCKASTCRAVMEAPAPSVAGIPTLTTFDYGHFTLEASTYVAQTLIQPRLTAGGPSSN